MTLVVNGAPHDHTGNGTLAALLTELEADDRRAAVMVNGEVIRRERRATFALSEGDEIEVLVLAAGG